MKKLIQLPRWLFWRSVYLLRRRSTDLDAWLLRTKRCWWPWNTFRPHVFHNDDGRMWHVYFTDERDYVERRTIDVEVHVGMESGNIVGLTVWDETLKGSGAATV